VTPHRTQPDLLGETDFWSGFRAGSRSMAPIMVAYVPLGLLVGAQVAASTNPLAAWLGTWTIYGGAAQLAVLDVLGHGSSWVAAAVAGLLVNMRLAAYATSMRPEWWFAPPRRRVAAAMMLSDPPWVLAHTRRHGRQQYFLGAAVTMFVVWPTLVSLGVLMGGRLGDAPMTSMLLPLTMAVLLAPQLRQRPAAMAMGSACVAAVVTAGMPAGASLAIIGAAGVLAGTVSERAS
jgi:predicted branched-subunit amino acid permease